MAAVEGKPIPINWQIPEDLPVLFTNNITIQHTGHEFILTFYQITPPPLLGPLAEQKLEQMEEVPAVAVARVAVSAGRLPDFVKAIQENIEKYYPKDANLESTNE